MTGLVIHIAFPNLAIDAISLGLLLIAILPWLAPLIKAAELPGGLKITFQDIQEAAERVAGDAPEVVARVSEGEPSYLIIADQDPSLALVGFRIEIEKRLRALAEHTGIPKSRPLTQLTKELQERGVLSARSAGGLLDLIALGNQAAHGVEVSPNAALSSMKIGPRVLEVLDGKLRSIGKAK